MTTSWDDGHPSDLRVADLLDKHGLTGTFYVPCMNCEGRPVMGSREIVRLAQHFEIGGHTRNHVILTDLAPVLAAREISSNKARLEDLLGREVAGFAYVRGRHNRLVRRLVAEAGYGYARTTTNLMDRPGSSLFRVPTTAQFYPHSRSVLLRNYVRAGPSWPRAAVLARLLRLRNLPDDLTTAARWCAASGGAFHLWGHSWELDQHELWDALDRFLGRLRQLPGQPQTNSEWCRRGPGSQRAPRPDAASGTERKPPVSLRKQAASLAVLHTADILQPLLILPYAGLVLGPEQFGQFAYAISLSQIAATVVDYGFHWTAQRPRPRRGPGPPLCRRSLPK